MPSFSAHLTISACIVIGLLAAARADTLSAQPAPTTETPAVSGTGATVRPSDIVGYWRFDQAYIEQALTEIETHQTDPKAVTAVKFARPMLTQIMAKQVIIINETTLTRFDGRKSQVTPYKFIPGEGIRFTLKSGKTTDNYTLENGRLKNLSQVDPTLGALFVLKKLTAAEIKDWDTKIAQADQPPPASASAEERLNFLAFDATPAQSEALLKSQPDLLTLKNAQGENALAMTLRASGDNKLEKLEKLLTAGADINGTQIRSKPILVSLFRLTPDKNREIIKLLVKHGADLKTVDQNDDNLVASYCRSGRDAEFLTWLIGQGIPVNTKSKFGRTALRLTIDARWLEGTRILLANGADLKNEPNALEVAVQHDDYPMIQLLAEHGLKQDSFGRTALIYLIGNWNNQAYSLQSGSIDAGRRDALQAELSTKRSAIITFIAANKDTIAIENKSGATPISLTTDLEIAKALISAGADPKAPLKPNSMTPAPLASAASRSLELTRFYIEQGLDINAIGHNGAPIHHAVTTDGNLATIQYLVENGAVINAPKPYDYSCLAFATRCDGKDSVTYVNYLLSKGADPKAQSWGNIEACITANRPDVLQLLVKAGLSVQGDYSKAWQSPLSLALATKNLAMIKLLLELGADPFEKIAARKSVVDTVQDPVQFPLTTPNDKAIFDLLTSLKPKTN